MNNPLIFFWLDDDTDRVKTAQPIIETGIADRALAAKLSIIKIGGDVLQHVGDYVDQISKSNANLVLVDHIFNETDALNTKGSSIAHILRNALPKVPVVGVSAAISKRAAFDQEDLSEYTHLFPFSQLSDDKEIELLYAIAGDFSKCVELATNPSSAMFVNTLLVAPEDDITSLEKILPSEFKEAEPPTTPHRIARWILETFLGRPGYLYDELRVACLLGISPDGFKKIQKSFDPARYTGVFATDTRPRWWVSQIHKKLIELVPERAFESSQIGGRNLPGISPEDFSKCWRDGEIDPPPDAVAFMDIRGLEEVCVRIEHTKTFPADVAGIPGFESRLYIAKKVR